MEQFFTDDDLFGTLEELEKEDGVIQKMGGDTEMEASNRRYEEIIRKHKME